MNAHHDQVPSILGRIAAAVAAMLAATLAVSAGAAQADADALSRIGASYPVIEFRTGTATPAADRERASGFASILAGGPVLAGGSVMRRPPALAQFQVRTQGGARVLAETPPARAPVHTDALASDADVAARAAARVAATPAVERIRVLVDSDRRDLLAVNGAVADDFSSAADVGPDRARAVFEATMQSLASNHLAADEALAPDALRTHRLMQGESGVGQAAVTRVKEYLFEVPHAIGGVEIFGAGTTIAVHRSGQLASIRTLGPSVDVSPTGQVVTRRVSTEALSRRAHAENPGARIVPVGLRYPWQAAGGTALATRPREVFQVIPQAELDGRVVNGRAHYVFYSVEDEGAAPLVWPRANPGAAGDVRK